jgi:iron complex transport system ATP-binding protein
MIPEPALSLDQVGFSFPGRQVLSGVSLGFRQGCFVSVLGPNGSGKTTLLDLMIRHLSPATGGIRLMGRDLAGLSRAVIARTAALVSQENTVRFPFRVSEVVMMGRHPHIPRFSRPGREDREKVLGVMDLTGLTPFRDRSVTELSGGERQRCLIARALCQDTPVLLLDEAFSSLDIGHTLELLGVIRRETRSRNRLAVAVFHDINLASAWSDELVFLARGGVTASGDVSSTFTEAVIQRTFGVESRVGHNEYSGARQAFFKGGRHGD